MQFFRWLKLVAVAAGHLLGGECWFDGDGLSFLCDVIWAFNKPLSQVNRYYPINSIDSRQIHRLVIWIPHPRIVLISFVLLWCHLNLCCLTVCLSILFHRRFYTSLICLAMAKAMEQHRNVFVSIKRQKKLEKMLTEIETRCLWAYWTCQLESIDGDYPQHSKMRPSFSIS